jgi:hypothetical protein
MICITGDIHNTSDGFKEQAYSEYSEMELALKYAEIAKKYDLKVTLFITGKSLQQEKDLSKKLSDFRNVELGGHTYNGLQPQRLHERFERYFGTYYGPYCIQMLDILITKYMLKKRTGVKTMSWRTHAYRSDFRTKKILLKMGTRVISDEVDRTALNPYVNNYGLVSLPINTCPDHEHIHHGYRTEDFVKNTVQATWDWKDSFGAESYKIDQWGDMVLEGAATIVERGGVATIMAHPLCMEVGDSMVTFDRLCSVLSTYKSFFARESVELCKS